MATTEHEAFNSNWSCSSQLTSEHQDLEDVSISEILDQGSISFGRYSTESLAWEKWSVFPHNRCQEELEKFKSDGLVAKKKAYFEEYYRKIRAMKGLQAEQQESDQTEPHRGAQSNNMEVVNGIDANASEEEKKPGSQNQVCDCNITADVDKSEQASNEQKGHCYIIDEKASVIDGTITSASTEEAIQSLNASPDDMPTISRSLKPVQEGSFVTDDLKHISDQRRHAPVAKKHGPVLKAKGTTIASKQYERAKQSVRRAITVKPQNSLAGNRSAIESESNVKSSCATSHRQPPKASSSVTLPCHSLKGEKMLSLLPTIKRGPESLACKSSSSLTVDARSAQQTSKHVTNAGGMRKTAIYNRDHGRVASKPLETSGCAARKKGGISENQRPNAKSPNIPAQTKSNKNIGADFAGRGYGQEGKQNKGNVKVSGGYKRDIKPVSSAQSKIQKASTPKPVQKVASVQSAGMMLDRRQPRQRIPVWR